MPDSELYSCVLCKVFGVLTYVGHSQSPLCLVRTADSSKINAWSNLVLVVFTPTHTNCHILTHTRITCTMKSYGIMYGVCVWWGGEGGGEGDYSSFLPLGVHVNRARSRTHWKGIAIVQKTFLSGATAVLCLCLFLLLLLLFCYAKIFHPCGCAFECARVCG